MTIQRSKSGLYFGDGCFGLDGIKTNNQERIINNPSKRVQPVLTFIGLLPNQLQMSLH